MEEIPTQEIDPETQDAVEDSQDMQEAQMDSMDTNYPTSKPESNLYNLFWKVLRVKDSTKVANLNKTEIGLLNISVREAQKLGVLGHLFHHREFGNFFLAMGEITAATSMARDGWFSELFVSQKKFQTRARKTSSQVKEGWKMFQKKPAATSSEDQQQ